LRIEEKFAPEAKSISVDIIENNTTRRRKADFIKTPSLFERLLK
jgi:hypothetical protein